MRGLRGAFKAAAAALMGGTMLAGHQAQASLGVHAETYYHAVCRKADGTIRWEGDLKNRVCTVGGLNKLLSSLANSPSANWYLGIVSQSVTDAAMASTGSAVITSASNPWLAEDAGQTIIVRGAGASGNDLITTILSFQSAGSVTLSVNAGTVVSGAKAVWGCRVDDTSASHTPWSEQTNYSGTRPEYTFGTPASGSVSNTLSPSVFTINADNSYIGGFFMIDQNTIGGATGNLYGMAVWTSGGFRQSYSGDSITVTGTLTLTSS